MKKYDENDIKNMLSKTEKTTPAFDKKVDFPSKTPLVVRRRKMRTVLIAACVAVAVFAVVPIGLIVNRGAPQPTLSDFSCSDNVFVSGVSYYPLESNDESVTHSVEDSFAPNESREPHGSMTENESSSPDCSGNESSLPLLEYPTSLNFYNGQGMNKGSVLEEFVKSNPHDHLGAMVRLPVYLKSTVGRDDCDEMLSAFSKAFGSDFAFDREYYAEYSEFRGSNNAGDVLNIYEFGDWDCYVNDSDFMSIIIEKGNPEAILGAVERFVIINPEIYAEGDRALDCIVSEDAVSVNLTISCDDDILSKLAVYSFEFERSDSVCTLKRLSHKAGNAVAVGKYEIRLYESAVKSLFEDLFIGEYGFEFSEKDEFIISAYDVRYLQSKTEAMICPYYVFVIEVEPYSDGSRYETVFIPAVIDEYLGDKQVD